MPFSTRSILIVGAALLLLAAGATGCGSGGTGSADSFLTEAGLPADAAVITDPKDDVRDVDGNKPPEDANTADIVRADDNILQVAGDGVFGQFELERDITALVFSEFFPVVPRNGFPIAGADDQIDAFAFPFFGNTHLARIPADVGVVFDAG